MKMSIAINRFSLWLMLCLGWALGSHRTNALIPLEGMSQYSTRFWQTDEGLPQSSVLAVRQTRDGYLWAGTREGLARFDGVRFTVFDQKMAPELKPRAFTALCETDDGTLWIGADDGLIRLKDGKCWRYTMTNGLAGNSVRTLFAGRDGWLWIGTTTGTSRFKEERFSGFPAGERWARKAAKSICEDQEGATWIATGDGLYRFNAGNITAYNTSNGLPHSVVTAVCPDRAGNIWIGTMNGLSRLSAGKLTHYTKADGLADNIVSALKLDPQGKLWIGTYGGLNWMADGKLITATINGRALFDLVYSIADDHEGNLWVGAKGGLYRLKARRFSTYTQEQGLSHNATVSVLEDEDRIWIGTWGGGLNQLKNGKITAPATGLSETRNQILGLHADGEGALWVGIDYDGGAYRMKAENCIHYGKAEGLPDSAVRVIHRDKNGDVWFGTSTALARLRNGKFTRYTKADGLAGNTVRVILEDDDGSLWIGTNEGLSRWRDGRFTNFTRKEGLSHNDIAALYEDRERTLWIGTEGGGLNRYRAGRFTSYTSEHGLFHDTIYGILEDEGGCLWMSCRKGIFRISKKQLGDFASGAIDRVSCVSFGKADGLETVECIGVAQPASCKSQDGRLWFATAKGLAVVDPNININERKPPVIIEALLADKKNIESGRWPFQTLQVPPGRGELEFHYTALSFQAPEKNRFKYQLEGIDPEWVDAGTRRAAYYNNLRPGRYRFRVTACNNDGFWSETGAQLAVVLLPHFWQTWWFQPAMFAILCSLGFGLYRVRAARLRQLERLRLRIAADLHDDIGSNVASIALLSQLGQQSLGMKPTERRELTEINRVALQTAHNIREIVWFINPDYDTLDEMISRMKEVAATMLGSIEYHFDAPTESDQTRLSLEFRRNIFLVFKESLHNIVKHAQASQVEIEVRRVRNQLHLRIQDNGAGFDEIGTHTGNGLKNLRLRMSQLGGTAEIRSQPDCGTTIQLSAGIT
jgi:ligand-binding sensor domain-containing protein